MGRSRNKYSDNTEATLQRLSWVESQEHYEAIKQIEKRNTPVATDEPNNQKKRFSANLHNEINKYLADHGLTYQLGGFYVEVYD